MTSLPNEAIIQIFIAIKWVAIISTAGFWVKHLVDFFLGDSGVKKMIER